MALVPFPGAQTGAARLPPDDDDELVSGQMSFLEHLDELRKRIIHACLGIAVGIVISFFFIQRIYDFLLAPAIATLPPGSRLIYIQPTEAFSLYVQISLISGIVVSSPFIMYQVWMFVAPGLYANEKRMAYPFVALTTIGFVLGASSSAFITDMDWPIGFAVGNARDC